MKIQSTRGRLLASTMICGAVAAFATTASAQDDTTNQGTTVQEIVVTGSRIPQPNLTSTSPLTVVNDQNIKLSGTTNVETLLQSLPSVVPEFNQGVDNGATGTATVSLRGLGSNRTLVLIDGNRLMPGDPIVPTPDLNNIPAALVDRVEVITGGASAVYGSDAVAGVVNFIMKRDFEGVRLDAQYGFYQHTNHNDLASAINDFNSGLPANQVIRYPHHVTDGDTVDVTVVLGVNAPDDRGNVTAYASYRNLKPVNQLQRDFGACGVSTVPNTSSIYDTHICQGSGNSAYGRFVDFVPRDVNGNGPCSFPDPTPTNPNNCDGTVANDPNGSKQFVPYSGAYAFNFGPYNYYQQADERYTAGMFSHYQLSSMADIYSDFMFADDKQITQAAPSGLFFTSGPVYSINCANPYMSAQQASYICGPDAPSYPTFTNGLSSNLSIGYRFAGHPRVTELDHTAYRIVLGSRGDLAQGWSYDAHLQYGKTNFRNIFTGDVSIRKTNDALNAVAGPDGPVCVSGNSGCVPLDIFQSLNRGITPEMFNYVSANGLKVGSTTEQIATASITGDLGPQGIKSPWATDGIGVAVGTEYRREELHLAVDEEFGSGDLSGNGGVNPPANGAFEVYELFGEARIPIVQDMPGIQRLSMELGYRWADYSSAGNVSAYKISGEYAPTSDIRFRAGYNRAVRAPNIVELFVPQTIGLASYNDPCSGNSPTPTAAQCALTGVTSQEYGNIPDCAAAQCSELLGGNPLLKPEKADTYTVGFVATPHWVNGLNFSLDWYDIKIDKPISIIGGATILAQCITTQTFCDLIHRDPNTGSLFGLTTANGYVIDTNTNTGSLETSGYDVSANYRWDIGSMGTLQFALVGGYLDKYVVQPATGTRTYDCAGIYGVVCGEPAPKWKHTFRTTWNTPWNLALSANWRHIGSAKLDINSSDPSLAVEGIGFYDSIDAKLKNYDYLDLSGTWRVRDKVTVRGGVNNVFDKDPPVVDANNKGIAGTSSFGNGNTFPGVYDTLGRNIFVGFTADF